MSWETEREELNIRLENNVVYLGGNISENERVEVDAEYKQERVHGEM